MGGGGVFNFKALCLVAILVIAASTECAKSAAAGGACGKVSPDKVALQLAPCAPAASDGKAKVLKRCCSQIAVILGKTPKCLCAVLNSKTAKRAGVIIRIAKTIPTRCGLKTPRGSC